MAVYIRQEFGNTIAPGATLHFEYSWENTTSGPNHGPVIFTADPRSHQSGQVKLITFNVAKCRRAPNPPQNPGTEVFYEYSVRSESNISAVFDLEVVWGERTPGPQASPW